MQNLPEDVTNDYLWNLRVIGHLEVIDPRKLGLAVASVASYQRERDRQLQHEREAKASQASEWIGQLGPDGKPGKMFNFVARVERKQTWDSDYGATYFHRMITPEGNVIVWKASTNIGLEEGHTYELRGKVKAHDTYRGRDKAAVVGIKQTVVTLVKEVKDITPVETPVLEQA